MTEKLLLIEDSAMITKVLRHLMKQQVGLACDSAPSLEKTQALLAKNGGRYLAAVVDLHLPDAPHGEALDTVLEAGVPAIVLTATFDEGRREDILKKPIVDYVVKENRYSYEYVARLVRRLDRNRRIKVLVADDSNTSRNYISGLLGNHLYQVYTAVDGREALAIMQSEPEIRLLIVDYNMPKMDGFELTRLLRQEYQRQDLVIIGLSGHGASNLSARFIKNGANDFLLKPFSHEEFHCRVMHNIEALENVLTLQALAERDHLTNLYNRRHLFESTRAQYQQARRNQLPFTVAVLDIDHFKRINDTFGHEVGDQVIRAFAAQMQAHFDEHLVARVGGEEFCIVLPGVSLDRATEKLEAFRDEIQQGGLDLSQQHLDITVSIGATDDYGETFEDMLKQADDHLYASKHAGRNQVTTDFDL
ncbi:diguanylate cyclase [Marinobacteraceae bacterium S3BR75-40.1]